MDDRQVRTRRPLIAGNWKMHKLPSEANSWTRDFLAGLAERIDDRQPLPCDIALAVPFTHLSGMARQAFGSRLALGAQDVSAHVEGAHTGEVSAAMVKDVGARYVIVGHSERRAHHHEDDALIKQKLLRCLEAGLIPILCVGESRDQRDAGEAESVVVGQLTGALEGVEIPAPDRLVVAYEPVWAIGTGLTATADDAQDMSATVRGHLATLLRGLAEEIRILYGGSMKPGNADELLARPDIDGGLIGGASIAQDDLLAIIASTAQ